MQYQNRHSDSYPHDFASFLGIQLSGQGTIEVPGQSITLLKPVENDGRNKPYIKPQATKYSPFAAKTCKFSEFDHARPLTLKRERNCPGVKSEGFLTAYWRRWLCNLIKPCCWNPSYTLVETDFTPASFKRSIYSRMDCKKITKDYLTVSSLYGPGAVGCWLCIVLSVFVSWTLNPWLRRRDIITIDLIAALSLPLIAATNLMGVAGYASPAYFRYGSSSWRLLRSEEIYLRSSATTEALLVICETGCILFYILCIVAWARGHGIRGCFISICALWFTAVPFAIGIRQSELNFPIINLLRPLPLTYIRCAIVPALVVFAAVCLFHIWNTSRKVGDELDEPGFHDRIFTIAFRSSPESIALWYFTLMYLLAGVISWWGIQTYSFCDAVPSKILFFIPTSSITIGDFDQAVALGAGVLTLLYSILRAFASREDTS
ncbi:uncharacterized protein BDR25DRAFT_359009 [Lindgomyces ingoldianus]|uniref:Uncharacterized protein n=1 Tax=Lindgomyces ingoldianus TaxID=673940 RepID=A0ACB6QIX8_9PLEO|nr:uncharacterized protein BDR25DRAFT_359009 [Lindgomyces ingoldianus]KAF2466948.1 hypothetical protein BDR25DRAFT_359009 [Lindgomyces ingoldianus]